MDLLLIPLALIALYRDEEIPRNENCGLLILLLFRYSAAWVTPLCLIHTGRNNQ